MHAGIPEAIIDGETGFLVEEHDAKMLAEKIQYLIEHPEVRNEFGHNARQLMLRKFNLPVQTEKLEQYYKEVINE